jgi:hypothetical protein
MLFRAYLVYTFCRFLQYDYVCCDMASNTTRTQEWWVNFMGFALESGYAPQFEEYESCSIISDQSATAFPLVSFLSGISDSTIPAKITRLGIDQRIWASLPNVQNAGNYLKKCNGFIADVCLGDLRGPVDTARNALRSLARQFPVVRRTQGQQENGSILQ